MSPASNVAEKMTFLKEIPLFSNLPDDDLIKLGNDACVRYYEKDDIIFHQGDNSYDLYFVWEGKVRIYKRNLAGTQISFTIFSSKAIIGEFAAIDHQPRSATAKAMTKCKVLTMPSDAFLYRVRKTPELAIALSRLLVSKLRWTTEYAETIARYDAAGRLLHLLLRYNEQFNQVTDDQKEYELDLSLRSQADLASLICVRRERVSSILSDWRKRGLIKYEAGKITILDLPRFEAELESRRGKPD